MHRPVPHVPGKKKPSTIFESWGRLVYRWRWAVLATSVLLFGLSIFALRSGGSLVNGSPGSSGVEASRARTLINQQLTSGQPSGTSFLLNFSSKDLPATDLSFRSQVEAALATNLVNDRSQHQPSICGRETGARALAAPHDGGRLSRGRQSRVPRKERPPST